MEVPASHQETFRPDTKNSPAVRQTDQQIEHQIGGDYDPIGGGERHFLCLFSCCN
jgi:hypothetical protein